MKCNHTYLNSWCVWLLIVHTFRLPTEINDLYVAFRIFGWVGDVIDILSIIATLFGVCTSLGLGVMQLNSGKNYFY